MVVWLGPNQPFRYVQLPLAKRPLIHHFVKLVYWFYCPLTQTVWFYWEVIVRCNQHEFTYIEFICMLFKET